MYGHKVIGSFFYYVENEKKKKLYRDLYQKIGQPRYLLSEDFVSMYIYNIIIVMIH